MVKILFIGYAHHKIRKNMIKGFKILGWEYKDGGINDIPNYDIIYSPATKIQIEQYPDKKFIFGPQFSIFPDNRSIFDNKYKNAIYIQPSMWAMSVWKNEFKYDSLPMAYYPIGVDTDDFNPKKYNINDKKKVFIYFKTRNINEINFIKEELTKRNVKYEIIIYGNYKEEYFKTLLSQTKYVIWVGRHESQGLAVLETMSMDVPMLVWNVKWMKQEVGQRFYDNIKTEATTIPYWDKRCGEYFYTREKFNEKYEIFLKKIKNKEYNPREFIMENLELKKQTNNFLEIINKI